MASGLIDYAGYTDCVYLENADTRVVLGHHFGGRVLEYAYKGENILALDPRQDGWTYQAGEKPRMGPSGGRFDIGPENTFPAHPQLWYGAWTADITSSGSARMTSVADVDSGLQLERHFALAPDSSHLACKQVIKNISDHEVRTCHWSRTFGKGHGICVVPLSPYSRFPKKYIMYGPGPVMDYQPDDPHITVDDDFLVMWDTPARPKLGIDAYVGWFAYLMPNDLMLVKGFPTYPDRVYNEMAGITISLWYFKDFVCELEPIGPMEILEPGAQASFIENWWIAPFSFPEKRSEVDVQAVTEVANSLISCST